MQKLKNFTPAHPRIGLDRVFIKSPQLDPNRDFEVDESDKFENEGQSDPSFIENLLLANSEKLSKYKSEGCVCIYDEKIFEFPKNKIYFSDLLTILTSDQNSEIELDKYKGKWIDSINQMIPIESLKSFSENLFKFDPLFPLNIQFESRFESGNLRMAIKVHDYEFDLIVNNDTNSGKASNWFYFRLTLRNTGKVNLTEQPQTYKFNIINCQKTDTLFSKGLKVLCYSSTMRKWTRRTKSNYYFLNGITNDEKKLYTLTFTYKVDYNFSEENLYFAYCFPYSYTNLQSYLSSILNNPVLGQKDILRHEIIGKSLSENNLDMIIITKFDCNFDEIAFRPCIVLTARVHPGESNSSYAIQGVIDFLLDLKNPVSEKLRKNFIFKIIPMLNPDGVINGNFRTSLVGKDLNRLWDEPRESVCPTIYHTKEMIKKTLLSREVYLFCDFHGHSNKPNFFLYGCPTSRKLRTQLNLSYQEMILSKIYFTKNDMFDHRSCIYKIAPKKMKTARAVVKNELNIDLSYCLESSIGYISIGKNKFCFFTPKSYNKIGYDFCLSLSDLTNKEIFSDTLQKIQAEEADKYANCGGNSSNNFNSSSTNNNSNNNNQISSNNKDTTNNGYFNNYASNNYNYNNNGSNGNNSNNPERYNNFNNSGNIDSYNPNSIGIQFLTPHSHSYTNSAMIDINIHNNNLNLNFNNGGGIFVNPNQWNFPNSTHHSHSHSSLINNKTDNQIIKENLSVHSKKNLLINEDSVNNKSKKESTSNLSNRDKENKNKESKLIKDKEIFKHIPQNKDKNPNNTVNNYNGNRERNQVANKNNKFSIKTPKNNSDIIINVNNNPDSNRIMDKDKEKSKNNKIKISGKDKENPNKSALMTTDKKGKKKKKKLNPLKTKKLFISAAAASENGNNTSNSNNQNNSNVPSLSSSFFNLNSINSNLVDISKLPKNLAKLEQISDKTKSNIQSANSTKANFMVKGSDSSFYGNASETPNLVVINKNNNNHNNIPNIKVISDEYVRKVNCFSVNKKLKENESRDKENSLNSGRKDITVYSEKEVNCINNNSSSKFDNINDIKTNLDRTFLPDFHLNLNFGEHQSHRSNLSLKCENSEPPSKCKNNSNFSNDNTSQISTFSLSGGNSQMISSFRNSTANSNQSNNINSISNIINLLSPSKSQRKSIHFEKNKHFEGQATDFNFSKATSNKNLMNSKFYEKCENKTSYSNCNFNDTNYFSKNNNTNSNLKAPNTIGGFGLVEFSCNNKEAFNKNSNFFMFSHTTANNQSSDIGERSKAKSINAKSIDPSKIYLTPTQKIYKTLNDNHVLFVKHIPKNK